MSRFTVTYQTDQQCSKNMSNRDTFSLITDICHIDTKCNAVHGRADAYKYGYIYIYKLWNQFHMTGDCKKKKFKIVQDTKWMSVSEYHLASMSSC